MSTEELRAAKVELIHYLQNGGKLADFAQQKVDEMCAAVFRAYPDLTPAQQVVVVQMIKETVKSTIAEIARA